MITAAGPWKPVPRGVRTGGRTRVGEFLGNKTVANLRDLIATVTFETERTLAAAGAQGLQWSAKDAAAYVDWKARLLALLNTWAPIAGEANYLFTVTPTAFEATSRADSQYSAASAWLDKLRALQTEFKAAGGTIDLSGAPAPKAANPDAAVSQAFGAIASATKQAALTAALVGIAGIGVTILISRATR